MQRYEIEDALNQCTTQPYRGCIITEKCGRETTLVAGSVSNADKEYVAGNSPSGSFEEIRRRNIAGVKLLPP